MFRFVPPMSGLWMKRYLAKGTDCRRSVYLLYMHARVISCGRLLIYLLKNKDKRPAKLELPLSVDVPFHS